MNFAYTILYVDDVEKTVAFYESAFGLTRKMVYGSDYGELSTGATTLSFSAKPFINELLSIPIQDTSLQTPPPAMEIALVTDDVQAAYARAIAAGAVAVKEPAAKPWGQIVAHVRDLNGFLVELCTAVS